MDFGSHLTLLKPLKHYNQVVNTFEQGKPLNMIMVDYSNTFDKVLIFYLSLQNQKHRHRWQMDRKLLAGSETTRQN